MKYKKIAFQSSPFPTFIYGDEFPQQVYSGGVGGGCQGEILQVEDEDVLGDWQACLCRPPSHQEQ